jgi:hypothetical protein
LWWWEKSKKGHKAGVVKIQVIPVFFFLTKLPHVINVNDVGVDVFRVVILVTLYRASCAGLACASVALPGAGVGPSSRFVPA